MKTNCSVHLCLLYIFDFKEGIRNTHRTTIKYLWYSLKKKQEKSPIKNHKYIKTIVLQSQQVNFNKQAFNIKTVRFALSQIECAFKKCSYKCFLPFTDISRKCVTCEE